MPVYPKFQASNSDASVSEAAKPFVRRRCVGMAKNKTAVSPFAVQKSPPTSVSRGDPTRLGQTRIRKNAILLFILEVQLLKTPFQRRRVVNFYFSKIRTNNPDSILV